MGNMQKNTEFNNKVVLITGGTSGIGKVVAKQFLQSGAKVVITGRNNNKGKSAASELTQYGDVLFVQSDVTSKKDCEHAAVIADKSFGPIDVLVVNAGINHVGSIQDSSEVAFDLIMDINLKGAYLSINATLPYLKASKGTIVVTGSDVALKGSESIPLYSVSKAALLMLSQMYAAELAPTGVRINSVLPANIIPGMEHNLDQTDPNNSHWRKEDITGPDWVKPPLGRFGKAEEVAQAILFLAGKQSSYCTGSHLLIDGGLNAAQE
jgi:NAD(P)-dependent dehydrogenase (short-subunit alcohol dehydrogenase family)